MAHLSNIPRRHSRLFLLGISPGFYQQLLVGGTRRRWFTNYCVQVVIEGVGIRLSQTENDLNSVALWRGRAVQPAPGKRRALSERSEFACRRGWRTAQDTRRATPRPQWFWVLLPNQKDLGCRAETRHLSRVLK
jgi:hypothetical protein